MSHRTKSWLTYTGEETIIKALIKLRPTPTTELTCEYNFFSKLTLRNPGYEDVLDVKGDICTKRTEELNHCWPAPQRSL